MKLGINGKWFLDLCVHLVWIFMSAHTSNILRDVKGRPLWLLVVQQIMQVSALYETLHIKLTLYIACPTKIYKSVHRCSVPRNAGKVLPEALLRFVCCSGCVASPECAAPMRTLNYAKTMHKRYKWLHLWRFATCRAVHNINLCKVGVACHLHFRALHTCVQHYIQELLCRSELMSECFAQKADKQTVTSEVEGTLYYIVTHLTSKQFYRRV